MKHLKYKIAVQTFQLQCKIYVVTVVNFKYKPWILAGMERHRKNRQRVVASPKKNKQRL